MRDRSPDLGPQNAPERAQGPPDPNGTTPSADPANRAPWLFQKGNTFGQMRKHHKGRMEKYIQEQTKDGARIVEFFLAVASGQPFLMKQILYLRLTPEQCAVARGTATPEQRKIAKKQRACIVDKVPYYPTVADMREAINWLADRGFGKAPQIVPIESGQPMGWPMEYRPWAPGTDPVSQGDGVKAAKATTTPGGSSEEERSVGGPRLWPPSDPRHVD